MSVRRDHLRRYFPRERCERRQPRPSSPRLDVFRWPQQTLLLKSHNEVTIVTKDGANLTGAGVMHAMNAVSTKPDALLPFRFGNRSVGYIAR